MNSAAAALLESAVASSSVTAVARRLGVARSSLSLVINGKYPGGTGKMEQRIMEILGQPCPVYGGTRGPEACASRRAASMPTSNPYALRQWRECQHLESCAMSIGVLGGKVGEEEWAYLRMLRANLMAHAVQARRMELGLSVACAAAGLAEPSQTAPNPAPDKGGRCRVVPFPGPFQSCGKDDKAE